MQFVFMGSVVALVSVFASSAFAGKETSGGGNAVVCFKTQASANYVKKNQNLIQNEQLRDIESVELLDLYEARQLVGEPPVLPEIYGLEPGEKVPEYAGRLLNRFEKTIPGLRSSILEGLKALPMNRIKNRPLFHVNDINPMGPPASSKCVYATIAAQEGTDLYIDRRLYDHPRHSELSKAVLFLHEYVRYVAIKLEHKDARPTRSLVAMIIRKNSQHTLGEWISRLQELGFKRKVIPIVVAGTYYDSEPWDYATGIMRAAATLVRFEASNSPFAFEELPEPMAFKQELMEFWRTETLTTYGWLKDKTSSFGHHLLGMQSLLVGDQYNPGGLLPAAIRSYEWTLTSKSASRSAKRTARKKLETLRPQLAKAKELKSRLEGWMGRQAEFASDRCKTAFEASFREKIESLPFMSDGDIALLKRNIADYIDFLSNRIEKFGLGMHHGEPRWIGKESLDPPFYKASEVNLDYVIE